MKVIKDTKKEFEVEITGESHSLCNTLRKTLMEDEDVEAAAYVIEHPIIGQPKLYVKGKNPKKSLKTAAETVKSGVMNSRDFISSSEDETKK